MEQKNILKDCFLNHLLLLFCTIYANIVRGNLKVIDDCL